MNQKDFTDIVNRVTGEMSDLLVVKGGEYAGSTDRLANFKRGAALTGVEPLTCLFIYMSKHYDSIATYVKDQQTKQERPRSEPIEGRLTDLMNYCLLAIAIIEEEKNAKQAMVIGGDYSLDAYRVRDSVAVAASGLSSLRDSHEPKR